MSIRLQKTIFFLAPMLVFVFVWEFFAVPWITRLPENFNYHAELNSFDNEYDVKTGEFVGEVWSNANLTYQATSLEDKALEIQALYDVRGQNGDKTFTVERTYEIDPVTGAHVPEFGMTKREGFLFAPKNLYRQDFIYWQANYNQPILMHFQNDDVLLGLLVYHYTADFKADRTNELTSLPEVGKTLGIESDAHLELWIEPKTGQLIQYRDNATAYYYNLATHEQVRPWMMTRNNYTQESVAAQVEQANITLQRLFIIEIIAPLLTLLVLTIYVLTKYIVPQFKDRRAAAVIPFFLFALFIASTLFIWRISVLGLKEKARLTFETETDDAKEKFTDRLADFANLLRSERGLFDSSKEVTQTEWHNFIKSIELQKNFPGIQGVGYLPSIILEKPVSSTETFPFEPFSEHNQHLFGSDLFQEPTGRIAVLRARDSGDVILSSKIALFQNTTTTPQTTLIMCLAVYQPTTSPSTIDDRRANVAGYVYSPFSIGDLVRDIASKNSINIDYEIYDGTTTDKQTKIYGSLFDQQTTESSSFSKINTIKLFGSQWTMRFFSSADYGLTATEKWLPWFIVIIGVLGSTLSSLLIYFLIFSRHRAVRLAEEMTDDLKRSRTELSTLINNLPEAVIFTDFNDRVLVVNKPFFSLFKDNENIDFAGTLIDDLIQKYTKKMVGDNVRIAKELFANKATRKIRLGLLSSFKDGRIVENDYIPLFSEGVFVGSIWLMRDVTERQSSTERITKTNEELQTLTQTMVGRELKMIELKKELEALMRRKNSPKKL